MMSGAGSVSHRSHRQQMRHVSPLLYHLPPAFWSTVMEESESDSGSESSRFSALVSSDGCGSDSDSEYRLKPIEKKIKGYGGVWTPRTPPCARHWPYKTVARMRTSYRCLVKLTETPSGVFVTTSFQR
ncbi:hypothetical protein TNCV_4286171 [Trichonephila clavipes]|nr:hypothetical protein TNCV_4286171 [Trichonephila clavipes]